MSSLKVMICDGGKFHIGPEKTKLVKVTNGEKTMFIKFGRHFGTKAIYDRLPVIFMDRAYDERRKKKAV